jgi:hypothetical protein
MKRPPHPDDAFFEQAIFDQVFGQRLLEWGLSALSSLTSSEVASREVSPASPFLPASRNSFDDRILQVLIDAFLAAQLGDADLTAKAFQNNSDLLLGRMIPACRSTNIPDRLLSALSDMRLLACLIVAPRQGYDEPGFPS